MGSVCVINTEPEVTSLQRWSAPQRTGFRLAFCYLTLYCLCSGNATVWDSIPVLGNRIQDVLSRIFSLPAQYLAGHLFHVLPPGDRLHPTGSGDTAIHWICVLVMFCVSLVATAVWTALDRARSNYRTLHAWLRFLIRLTLAFGMVTYGLDKLFPLQMPSPSIASLSEPLGMHSPMSLLWNFVGTNPLYEMLCGTAELLAGVLLLVRRTALAGALFSVFVVANVLAYNLFFDVPVKLYSGHLLLLALFLILPDASPLFRFFWQNQPAAPRGVWVAPTSRPVFRHLIIAFEIAFAAVAIGGTSFGAFHYTVRRHQEVIAPCPLCGDWRIDDAAFQSPTGHIIQRAPRTSNGNVAVELIINSASTAVLRDASGGIDYFPIKTDVAGHTITFITPHFVYSSMTPDQTHLILTPIGDTARSNATLRLTLLTPAGGYPLMHRGFHWISEFPYQR